MCRHRFQQSTRGLAIPDGDKQRPENPSSKLFLDKVQTLFVHDGGTTKIHRRIGRPAVAESKRSYDRQTFTQVDADHVPSISEKIHADHKVAGSSVINVQFVLLKIAWPSCIHHNLLTVFDKINRAGEQV